MYILAVWQPQHDRSHLPHQPPLQALVRHITVATELQKCFAEVFCRSVLQKCFAEMFCRSVLQKCFAEVGFLSITFSVMFSVIHL